MSHPALASLSSNLSAVLDEFTRSLAEIRTSRATPSLLEGVKVLAYEGSAPMKLVELASVSSPDAALLVVKPWDPSVKSKIVKAIEAADLGFTCSVEGDIIRVPVPALTQERRREFAKLVIEKSNQAKEAVRSARREAIDELEKEKEGGSLPEDDFFRLKKEAQDEVDKANADIKELADRKESELMKI